MRRLENKETKILNSDDNNRVLKYSDLSTIIISKGRGITRSQMEYGKQLADKIKTNSEKEFIILEDAEYDFLKHVESNVIWEFTHDDIVAFGKALDNAEKFTVN